MIAISESFVFFLFFLIPKGFGSYLGRTKGNLAVLTFGTLFLTSQFNIVSKWLDGKGAQTENRYTGIA